MSPNRILILLVALVAVLFTLCTVLGRRQSGNGTKADSLADSWVSLIPGPPSIAPSSLGSSGVKPAKDKITGEWTVECPSPNLVLTVPAGGGLFSKVRGLDLSLVRGNGVGVHFEPLERSAAPEDQPLDLTLKKGDKPLRLLVPRSGGKITLTTSTPAKIRLGAAATRQASQ